MVSLVCFNEWAHFLRRLSGSTNFTFADECISGRRKGGAGWRAVARGQQKEGGDSCSEMAYTNIEQQWEGHQQRINAIHQKGKKEKDKNTRLNNSAFTKKKRKRPSRRQMQEQLHAENVKRQRVRVELSPQASPEAEAEPASPTYDSASQTYSPERSP